MRLGSPLPLAFVNSKTRNTDRQADRFDLQHIPGFNSKQNHYYSTWCSNLHISYYRELQSRLQSEMCCSVHRLIQTFLSKPTICSVPVLRCKRRSLPTLAWHFVLQSHQHMLLSKQPRWRSWCSLWLSHIGRQLYDLCHVCCTLITYVMATTA